MIQVDEKLAKMKVAIDSHRQDATEVCLELFNNNCFGVVKHQSSVGNVSQQPKCEVLYLPT